MKRLIAMTITLCILLTAIGTLPFTVSAASGNVFWNWEFTGQRSNEANKLVVSAPRGGSNRAEKRFPELSTKFDVEFTASIDNYGKGVSFSINSGTHRFVMNMNKDGFTYTRNSSNGGGTVSVNADIGSGKHTYRIAGDGSKGDIYIDDYYIETIYVENSSLAASMQINAQDGAKVTVSRLEFQNLKSDTPATQTPPASSELEEPEEPEKKKPEGFSWEFDGNDDLSKVVNIHRYEVRADEGVLYGIAPDLGYYSSSYYMDDFGDDFVFETRLKLLRFGNTMGFTFAWDRMITFYIRDRFLYANNQPGQSAGDAFDLTDPNEWHDLKFETYNTGTRCRLFIDGKKVYDCEPNINTGDKYVYFYHTGFTDPIHGTNEIMYDYMRLTPTVYPIHIDESIANAVYMKGQPINLYANVEEGEEIPYVDYKINGHTIATGQAPDYKASVASIPAGKWEITAEYQDKTSGTTTFEVLRPIGGELAIEKKSDTELELSIQDFHDEQNRVKQVEYLVDGVTVATENKAPFTASVENLTKEGHTIIALLKLEGGITIQQLEGSYVPALGEEDVSVSYSNELSYEVTGEEGEASILLSNGRHTLDMTHTKDGVTYRTIDGEETYPNGTGRFRIITDGPYVEGYYGGQFAFSFLMPRTTKVERKVDQDGLEVKDFTLSIPEIRKNYYTQSDVPAEVVTHQLPNLGSAYNLDFIAGAGDEGEIVVNDGFFCSKIILEDGKLYTWTVQEEWGEPYKVELGELPKSGTAYYRVDTVEGISRISADGKWINSFRSILSMGTPQLGIGLTGGDGLEYLAVNDYTDVYVHEDMLDGEGDIDSVEYWRLTSNMEAAVDQEKGVMSLKGEGDRARAELNAYAGDMDFSADVELLKCDGGFWLTFGRTYDQWYNKVGYNTQTGMFELAEARSDNNKAPTITNTIAEKDGTLPLNKTMHVELKTRLKPMTKEVVFLIDGEEIFHQEIDQRQNGMIGFMLSDAEANVSNINYRGDAKPMVGLTNYAIKHGMSTADMVEVGDNMVMIAEGLTGSYFTSDGGKTWTSKGFIPLVEQAGRSAMRMSNGEIITITRTNVTKDDTGKWLRVNGVHVSADDGATWTTLDPIQDDYTYDRDQMAGRISQGASGRVYYISAEVGNENFGISTLFYSDDFGRSWTPSETPIDGWELGFAHQEPVVHELPNGVVRCWLRNDKGFVVYLDSYDYGKTFDTSSIKMTPLPTTLDTIGVDQDPNDPNTFYFTWAFDNANLNGQPMYSRTRAGMAKSTDGGETWDYLGTILEINAQKGLSTYNNTNLDVGSEYVVWNAPAESDSETSNDYGQYIVFPKDKQVPSKRYERLHHINDTQLNQNRVLTQDTENTTLIIHEESQRVCIFGEVIEDAYYDGKISLDVAAAYLSATIENEADGGVTLLQGDVEFTFDKDEVAERGGKKYISLDAFVEENGLLTYEGNDILIIGMSDQWSNRQVRAMRMTSNLFVKEL